jgi:hypothetical protein
VKGEKKGAYYQSISAQGPDAQVEEEQSACTAVHVQFVQTTTHSTTQGRATEAGRMHSGEDNAAQEAEFGAA